MVCGTYPNDVSLVGLEITRRVILFRQCHVLLGDRIRDNFCPTRIFHDLGKTLLYLIFDIYGNDLLALFFCFSLAL